MDRDGSPILRLRRPAPHSPASAADGADRRLLRVAASCPRCASRPALRVTPAAVRALDGTDPAIRVGTYQCQRRGCGALYDLSAEAFQKAS
ncbi:MAG TPA: hypothetical protein VK420_00840 [Longimicrobium sp.]|nr:hypothetical protein [Longimicrobium sp.]